MANLFSRWVAVRVASVGVLIWSPNLVVRASLALIRRLRGAHGHLSLFIMARFRSCPYADPPTGAAVTRSNQKRRH
jgi:hypothetical protein